MKLSSIAVLAYRAGPNCLCYTCRSLAVHIKLNLLTPTKNMDIAYIGRVIEMGDIAGESENFTKTIIPTNLLIFRVVLN